VNTIAPGMEVRLVFDPGRSGLTTNKTRVRAGATIWLVKFSDQSEWIPEDQLEPIVDEIIDPVLLLSNGAFARASELRKTLTHIRLNGKLANVIYSMETTNTEFFPHQFKPVIRFLNSPAGGMLIADEVGLGKTIEAGLLWTELRSRFDAQRLFVLCPPMLRDKWAMELRDRFGIEAQIVNAREALERLQRVAREGATSQYALIGSFDGLRPAKDWNDHTFAEHMREGARSGTLLAAFLDEQSEIGPLIDLLVVDEAHKMRNPDTATAKLGRLLKDSATNVVFLSATPVHLRSDDLYHLLNLLDEDMFNNSRVFDDILEANAPLVRARDLVLSENANIMEFREALEEAAGHYLLAENRQLHSLLENCPDEYQLKDRRVRIELAERLESLNLLGHVVSRTRKREVTEWRVQREVIPQKVSMTPVEEVFYMGVTQIVRDYGSRVGAGEGFLLSMPQRQISSCMPAALRHWQNRLANLELQIEENEELYEDLGLDVSDQSEPPKSVGPLVMEIISKGTRLVDVDELERNDSKFNEFGKLVTVFLSDHPHEKLVVFSFFRATLRYLQRRLKGLGVSASVLSGAQGTDKSAVLDRFRDPAGPRVLLSSEVGSEGIDLQFCRVMVNYDLPWNPMRVEQRIGRLDRLGQQAEKIVIWNLFYEKTIDERIYTRLYERLQIFKKALGGMEEILGQHIQQLTSALLTGRLSPEQEEQRIEQAAQAIENVRFQEEQLENQAGDLIAHGDYILNQVRAAKTLRRLITGADLERYVRDFLQEHFTGSSIRLVNADTREFDVDLSPQAKVALGDFVEKQRLQRGTGLHRSSGGPIRCRFDNKVAIAGARRAELINQLHPLVRFVTARIRDRLEKGETAWPVISIRLRPGGLPNEVIPGHYVFSVHMWSVEGLQPREHLLFLVQPLSHSGSPLTDDAAERLIVTAAAEGTDWLEARHMLDLASVASLAESLGVTAQNRYHEFVNRMRDENNDRADLQMAAATRHLENQTITLAGVKSRHLQAGRTGLAKATQGKIDRLRANVEMKRLRIAKHREISPRQEEVCLGVLEVTSE
jgi:SNF2 family DNA or RNA helicase